MNDATTTGSTPICGLTGHLPPGQDKVLYFDTEQGRYYVLLAVRRICRQAGIPEPDNLEVYGLRSKPPAERLKLIEAAIENTPGVGLVVIDGARDIVTSINDEEQATEISSLLLKWTEERNIHIITVLHQNKSDNNARGHLGTELINKAETVLSVTKADNDRDISVVTPEYCRNKEPEPFAFEITVDGLPTPAENYEIRTAESRKLDVTEMDDWQVRQMLNSAFSEAEEWGYTDLVNQVKRKFKKQFTRSIGTNKAKELITLAKANGWLKQEKPKAPYTLAADPQGGGAADGENNGLTPDVEDEPFA